MTEEKEMIDHPSHYTAFPIEPVQLIRGLDFYTGSIFKYVIRAPYKGKAEQDFKKARWYLQYLKMYPECRFNLFEESELDVQRTIDMGEVRDPRNWDEWVEALAPNPWAEDIASLARLILDLADECSYSIADEVAVREYGRAKRFATVAARMLHGDYQGNGEWKNW